MNGEEFLKALDSICEEKNIDRNLVIEAVKQSLATAYKKNYKSKTNVRVDFDEDTGNFKVMSYYVVVDDYIDSTFEYDDEGFVEFKGKVDCYGNVQQVHKIFSAEEWTVVKKRGYYMG